jgi:hypothetical protein
VLDAWVGGKGSLYARDSSFRCDDACPRYGCRGELLVSVTLRASLRADGWWDRMRERIEALDTPDGVRTLLSSMKIAEALNL